MKRPALGNASTGVNPLPVWDGWVTELLEQSEQRLQQIAQSYAPPVRDYVDQTLAAGGKRLRPALVFLCAGGAWNERALLQAGTAIELLHMATLVHDDVLDRASLRRGRMTVYKGGGRPAATSTGDVLFSRAFTELCDTESEVAITALSQASAALARGELMQRADAWCDRISDTRYLQRCELKTGQLFEAACRLGAIFGAPTATNAEALGRFGSRVGLAFQILDDVLDVAGSVDHTGKHRGTDLLDGTVTLPLIIARELSASTSGLDIHAVRDAPQRAEEVCDRIAATGALEQARERALAYVAEAKDILAQLMLDTRQVEALNKVCDQVVARYA
jgi:geranylgeranyl pyrophosphate synthase